MRTGTTATWADWCCDALPVEALELCPFGNVESSGAVAVQGQCGRPGWVQDKGKSLWEGRVWISELVEKRALWAGITAACTAMEPWKCCCYNQPFKQRDRWSLERQRGTSCIPWGCVSPPKVDTQYPSGFFVHGRHTAHSVFLLTLLSRICEERVVLQHWATAFVPAHQGNILTYSLSISNVLLILFLSIFLHNTSRGHQTCLLYTWVTDLEDRSASTLNVLNYCTSRCCLVQTWQLQGRSLTCWQHSPTWALRGHHFSGIVPQTAECCFLTALGWLWSLVNAEKVFLNAIPLHLMLQQKLSPAYFIPHHSAGSHQINQLSIPCYADQLHLVPQLIWEWRKSAAAPQPKTEEVHLIKPGKWGW